MHLLERIYPHVPVWAQNLGISLYGLAWRHERLGGDFDHYVSEFHERDRWSRRRMQDYVEQQLREVLLHAYVEVPYYRTRWNQANIGKEDLRRMTIGDLCKLPPTQKQDLRSAPETFVAQDIARAKRLHRYHSSGSTGTPVTAICTSEAHRRFTAAREVRSFGWAGTSIRMPRSMLGGRLVVPRGNGTPPFHRYNWAERQVYLSAYHMAPGTAKFYVSAFNRYRPQLLTGYAYSHYILARMMADQGLVLDYQPRALVLSSEKLTVEMKTVISKAFRARAFEEYGAVENCMLATECQYGSLHVSPDFGVIEIVDDDYLPVSPGREGRILCTSLLNEAQPLIRYEIGDLGVWSTDVCACGRDHLPILQEVVGRLEDVVVGRDGRELVRFHGMFVNVAHVVEAQVIQEALDSFVVRTVVEDGFSRNQEQQIRHRFQERLGPVKVRIDKVKEIPRTERGKFRAVISLLSETEKGRQTL
jgi:phenylacetate-CoA ligase